MWTTFRGGGQQVKVIRWIMPCLIITTSYRPALYEHSTIMMYSGRIYLHVCYILCTKYWGGVKGICCITPIISVHWRTNELYFVVMFEDEINLFTLFLLYSQFIFLNAIQWTSSWHLASAIFWKQNCKISDDMQDAECNKGIATVTLLAWNR